MCLYVSRQKHNAMAVMLHNGGLVMLGYAILFFVIALVAAVFGFGGIAGAATGIAQILFVVFLVLFILSLIFGRRPKP
jgi:uncharacterized membrane protein YtjA (UPF0391 family)